MSDVKVSSKNQTYARQVSSFKQNHKQKIMEKIELTNYNYKNSRRL